MFKSVLLAALIESCIAQKVGLKSTLGFACFNSAFKYDFGCPVPLPYNCRCANDNYLATALACVYLYGTNPYEIDAGYDYIQDQCFYWGNRSMTPQELDTILFTNMEKFIQDSETRPGEVVQKPVVIPNELYNSQFTGSLETQRHYKLGEIFGITMVVYWAVVMLFATLGNLNNMGQNGFLDRIVGYKVANTWRHVFTLPPAVGNRHHVPHRILGMFSISAPTRGQSVVVIGFIVINIVSLALFYDETPDDKPLMFVTNGHKIMRYAANRTGIIAVSLLPLIVLFASRNNPLITITGWGYDTFQLYHRWCARMMALQAVVHAVLLTWYSAEEHVVKFKWQHVYNWAGGNVACYLMIIMVVFALREVRVRVYEVFIAVHKFCFVGFLVGLFVHLSDYGWMAWIITTAVFYFMEYSARATKVIKSGWIQEAEFSIASNDMYRVTTTQKREWTFSAGQYAYIRILEKSLFWQEHPFSLFKGSESQLELMCKAKNGATKKIYDMLKDSPDGKRTFKVMIEGPYGREHNLRKYNAVFILAGGVGITAMYSYITCVVPTLREEQYLTLIWVLKDEEYVQAHFEEIKHLVSLSSLANIQIYLSRASPPNKAGEGGECKSTTSSRSTTPEASMTSESSVDTITTFGNVIMYGRPRVSHELSEFINGATGSIAVCACGPPSFVDGARNTIVENIRKSNSLIHYFEEAFSW